MDQTHWQDLERKLEEKEILLSLIRDIASIRNKEDLQRVLQIKLQKHLAVSGFRISLIDKASSLVVPFLIITGQYGQENPELESELNRNLPLQDGLFDKVLETGSTVKTDLTAQSVTTHTPKYIRLLKTAGLTEIVSVPLQSEEETIGVMCMIADSNNKFRPEHYTLIESVSAQISIAVANILAHEAIARKEEEKSILLSLSNSMALVRSKQDLASTINQKLKELFFIKDFTIVALDQQDMTFGAYLFDENNTPYLQKREYLQTLYSNFKFEKQFYDLVLQSDKPVIFDIKELASQKNAAGHALFFHSIGIDFIIGAALRIGNTNFGVLWIQPENINDFNTVNRTIFTGVCSQISIALSNIIANEALEKQYKEKEILLSLSNAIASTRDKTDLLKIITHQLKQLFNYNDASIIILDQEQKTYSAYLLDMEEKRTSHPDCLPNATGNYAVADRICDAILAAEGPIVFDNEELIKQGPVPSWLAFLHKTGIHEMVSVALRYSNKNIGAFFLHSENKNYFKPYQLRLIQGISYQLSIAMANILANEEIARQLEEIRHYKSQLEEENQYLQEQVEKAYNHSELIGKSQPMQKVFHMLSQVSFTNSTVLILGETGTGKELIARAVHNASSRKDKLMIKVNCAALPANLIESELFGHEKGAFTGAIERRIGKFEMAHKGTLFLDEIGELPVDLQVKLLRVLQEKEIERVGGQTTIKTDVRLIAATNRNLQKEVEAGRFRSDLYYRLHVFPIVMPPLRERKEDIPLLVTHFIKKHTKRTGREISTVTKNVMNALQSYHWPGNVRELEHFIERAVLLNSGNSIRQIDLPSFAGKRTVADSVENFSLKTLEENERDHILAVLRNCNGKVFGPGGAAELLDIHVSTLNSRMKKLGIKKEHIFVQKK
ncbi:sigma 54-interacting transcriptional regulator [Xanthocytophaga flava]|uniref:sigma 54-interacting transcriptional regulator n=1 Tax=Xanthocytophaga flava TaxID=3048013 RepID=UPI0028D295F8|nr:sigma 54-interacting transcriptional regulator [Xanthocytophaga flavus]MDJ1471104.1 sigma 54-interacting transcriptional regulator [Xanthocytophaga flavus]